MPVWPLIWRNAWHHLRIYYKWTEGPQRQRDTRGWILHCQLYNEDNIKTNSLGNNPPTWLLSALPERPPLAELPICCVVRFAILINGCNKSLHCACVTTIPERSPVDDEGDRRTWQEVGHEGAARVAPSRRIDFINHRVHNGTVVRSDVPPNGSARFLSSVHSYNRIKYTYNRYHHLNHRQRTWRNIESNNWNSSRLGRLLDPLLGRIYRPHFLGCLTLCHIDYETAR